MKEDLTYFNQIQTADRIDGKTGVISGVSLITMGTARGHDLVVDEKTLEQLSESLKNTKPPGIKAKLNHRSGVEAVFGFINNVRVNGMKLVGDLHMLQHHKDYSQTMEQLETMPGQIGLSVAFQGDKEQGSDGKTYARCKNIVSVDLVSDPAANPDGLFEAKVDILELGMEEENQNPETEVLDRLSQIAERLEGVEGFQDDLSQAINESLEEDADDYEDEVEEVDEEYEDSYTDEESELEPAGQELSSIDDALTYLEAKAEGALEAEKEIRLDASFDNIDDKITELSSINEELVAENEALRDALEQNGVSPLEPGKGEIFGFAADEGTFEFAAQVSDKTTEFESIRDAVKNDPQGHRDWLVRQGIFGN